MAGRILIREVDLPHDVFRRYIQETIAGMVAASSQLPLTPANLPYLAQIGNNILAFEALLRHLPQ